MLVQHLQRVAKEIMEQEATTLDPRMGLGNVEPHIVDRIDGAE